jgi:prepilin-type N-terminal cleavage/methylation domain-containing protein
MRGTFPTSSGFPWRPGLRSRKGAFTLTELLVVMTIIGLMTAISIPAFRGLGQSNIINAAQRQLVDDLGFARLQAIKNRAPVYMVFFMSPYVQDLKGQDAFNMQLGQAHQTLLNLPQATDFDNQFRETALRVYTNTFPQQNACYALFTDASLGEQPGVRRLRYLTEWRSLPDGALFPTNGVELRLPAFITGISNRVVLTNLLSRTVPFPVAPDRLNDRTLPQLTLPAIGFDSQGRLYSFKPDGTPKGNGTTLSDRYVAVGIGSVTLARKTARNQTNQFDFSALPDVVETPRYNYTNHVVRISALTGRAKYLKPPQP